MQTIVLSTDQIVAAATYLASNMMLFGTIMICMFLYIGYSLVSAKLPEIRPFHRVSSSHFHGLRPAGDIYSYPGMSSGTGYQGSLWVPARDRRPSSQLPKYDLIKRFPLQLPLVIQIALVYKKSGYILP